MDLFFFPTKGKPFAIEVGYFDTILEVKEKVQKYHGIPIPKQTLIFKGNVLDDDLNIHYSDILHRSHIKLVIDVESTKNKVVKVEYPSSSTRKIKIILKMPISTKPIFTLEANAIDSILRVKKRIHEMGGVHAHQLILRVNGVELIDHYSFQDYEFSDKLEIDVSNNINLSRIPGSLGALAELVTDELV